MAPIPFTVYPVKIQQVYRFRLLHFALNMKIYQNYSLISQTSWG
jgi:hypothetical protein